MTNNSDTDAGTTNSLGAPDVISVRGARQHNLKNINVDIPRGKLVVITGPSGSGKSSLAIDTIFAEGQRQYIETLSVYSRNFIQSLPRADVDWIEGLQPTLCINQFQPPPNPRSTVGTITEILDYLRVLYARLGKVTCYQCGSPIRQMESEAIIESVAGLPQGTKLMVLAPMVQRRRGKNEDTLEKIRRSGLLRARVNGRVAELDQIELPGNRLHTIEAVTDRLIIRGDDASGSPRQRLRESIQLAIELGEGVCITSTRGIDSPDDDDWADTTYSTRYACIDCGVHYQELEPRNFSFNNPEGACATCNGLGGFLQFDIDQIIPDRTRSFSKAFAIWKSLTKSKRQKKLAELQPFFARHQLDAEMPTDRLTDEQWNDLLGGDQKQWIGLHKLWQKELATCLDSNRLLELESFRAMDKCPECRGSRLGTIARAVYVGDQSFDAVNQSTVADLLQFFNGLEFPEDDRRAAKLLLTEIRKRLRFLDRVSLGYLTLNRPTETLSGGEYQRVRLASAIGTGLSQVCFVLDEPTIGLHSKDNRNLIGSIKALRDQGNTVIVVEHDREMIEAADWIIDIGPRAGRDGGSIVFQGTLTELRNSTASPTGRYLASPNGIAIKRPDAELCVHRNDSDRIELLGAVGNNLKDVDIVFPLGKLVCLTGVSGSGKSSLVQHTLAPALLRKLGRSAPRPLPFREINVSGRIDNLVQVDQRPIGRSPRSNAATYTGVMDEIRKVFSQTRDAKMRGFSPSRFSFNSKAGQCPECRGAGSLRIEMKFLPDMQKTCPACHGHRYDWSTLQVDYRDRSIADVLEMPISDALNLFENIERIRAPLQALVDVGLGYLSLGQSSSTLSGGEAQRVKLAAELGSSVDFQRHHVYLMDEPTTGLHSCDVERLLLTFRNLVFAGHSVIVIEHQEDVIANSDFLIEMGPGAGAAGGELVLSERK